MRTIKTTEFNKMRAEFLGGKIYENRDNWEVLNWNNPKHFPNQIIQVCPFRMYGTKEQTYQAILSRLTSDYGEWGNFHSDWNWIMKVVEKIEETTVFVKIRGCTVDIPTIANTVAPTKKEAVVQAINSFFTTK